MQTIVFYKTQSGRSPVEQFLSSLSGKQVQRVTWVLTLIKEIEIVPRQYFKKLVNTDEIWEVRVKAGRDTFRLLGFFDGENLIILTNGFAKKTQKTPKQEIDLAEQRRRDYLERKEL